MFTLWKRKKTERINPVQMAERSAWDEGRRFGYAEGFTAGKAEGYNEGIAKAKQAALQALKQKGKDHGPVSKL